MIKHWQDIQVKCNELVVKMKFGKDKEMPEWAGRGVGQPAKIVVVERDEMLDGADLEDIANADHVFIPIIRKPKEKAGETEEQMEERTQVYLVHLQLQLKKVNIFTSAFYDNEDGEGSEFEDGTEFAKIELVDQIMKYKPTNQVEEMDDESSS